MPFFALIAKQLRIVRMFAQHVGIGGCGLCKIGWEE
jgi:hypothetical protein